MRNAPSPLFREMDAWPNQDVEAFPEELALAQRFGIKPLSPDDPEFDVLMKSGQRFNWAILLDGVLRVSPSTVADKNSFTRISHAILADGREVLAAGEGRGGGFISHTTGHYLNEEFVVAPVRRAFEQIGIMFKQ